MARRRAIASELHHKARALAGTDDRRSMESGEFVERCELRRHAEPKQLVLTTDTLGG